MKKLKKYIYKLLIIKVTIILIVFSVITKPSYATETINTSNMSEDELRSSFVEVVKKFVEENGNMPNGKNICKYPSSEFSECAYTYENGIHADGQYHFCCTGWSDFAFHRFLGLGNESYTTIVSPKGIRDTAHFERQELGTEKPRRCASHGSIRYGNIRRRATCCNCY